MIQFTDIVDIIGQSFFGGNTTIAGIVVLCIVLAVIMTFSKSVFTTLIIAIPVTLIFTSLSLLPIDVTIILILVCVLGLAYTARGVFT